MPMTIRFLPSRRTVEALILKAILILFSPDRGLAPPQLPAQLGVDLQRDLLHHGHQLLVVGDRLLHDDLRKAQSSLNHSRRPRFCPHLARHGPLDVAQLLDGRVAVLPLLGHDAHHELRLAALEARADLAQVRLDPVVWQA